MLVSFFESVKYVGHLIPIAFLRVFLGYYYFQQGILKYKGDFLDRPNLAAQVAETLPKLQIPTWYKSIVENLFIPNWQVFAFTATGLEFAIAVSYLLGYMVRPTALFGVFLSFNMLMISGPGLEDFYRTLLALHLAMAWVGAGRCLGFDYYFFKRRRGIWW